LSGSSLLLHARLIEHRHDVLLSLDGWDRHHLRFPHSASPPSPICPVVSCLSLTDRWVLERIVLKLRQHVRGDRLTLPAVWPHHALLFFFLCLLFSGVNRRNGASRLSGFFSGARSSAACLSCFSEIARCSFPPSDYKRRLAVRFAVANSRIQRQRNFIRTHHAQSWGQSTKWRHSLGPERSLPLLKFPPLVPILLPAPAHTGQFSICVST